MNVRKIVGTLALVSLTLASMSAHAAWYVSDITVPGNYTLPVDINDAGQIVGTVGYADSWQAFLYNKGNVNILSDISNLAYVEGINSKGQIVGSYQGTGSFIYDNGKLTNLYQSTGSTFQALAINDVGQVSGLGSPGAALYSNGTVTDVGGFDFAVVSWGWGINNSGAVAGVSMGDGKARSFVYQDGKTTDLGTLGGNYTHANAINNAGQVVGASEVGGQTHAFLYEGGKITDIGALVGTTYNSATDINDKGQVLIGSIDANEARSFLYENGSLTDLSTLPEIVSKGWSNIQAIAINNLGDILGVASINNAIQAFVLSPNRQYESSVIVGQFAAPEIDGSNAMLGIAVLGGFLSLTRRRKSRQS